MRNYDLVIFDMDGTLVDTEAAHKKMFDRFFDMYFPHHKGMDIVEGGKAQTMLNIFRGAGLDDEEISTVFDKLDIFYRTQADDIIDSLGFIEGAREVILALSKQKMMVALISNSMHELVYKIAETNKMADEFNVVLGAHREAQNKRDRFKNMLAETGIAPERALYIGDVELDVTAAHECGMDCCILYTPIAWLHSLTDLMDKYKPDYVITDINKVLKIAL